MREFEKKFKGQELTAYQTGYLDAVVDLIKLDKDLIQKYVQMVESTVT